MERFTTGVPRAYETAFPQDPPVAICLGPYGGPGGWAFSYERGIPAGFRIYDVKTAVPGLRVEKKGFRAQCVGCRVQGSCSGLWLGGWNL